VSSPTTPPITRIESFAGPNGFVAFVRVTLSDGSSGWGQVAPYNADISATVLHRQVARHFLGKSPDELEACCDAVIRRNHKFPWSYVCRAMAGVDLAVWDLRGKRAEQPVARLLGGELKPLPAYASSMRRDLTPAEEADRLSRLRDESGFSAFKVRVGSENGRDVDAAPGRTEQIIPAMRQALGDDATILADANGGFSPRRAIEVGRILEANGFAHFEEPCPFWEWEQTAQVAEALQIDVAAGEQDNDPAQFRRMLHARAVDLVQPDVCYVGGLTRMLQIAEIAHELGIPTLPHAANRTLLLVATHHLMTAIDRPGRYVEFGIEAEPHFSDLYSPAPRIVAGQLHVPDGPGWGVEINEQWLAGATRVVSEVD
jgi:L-alanine-DL-glutamate epimerase-like enolase superfamily enzyme